MFRTRYGPGQRALFNVLRAFSNYDKQVGYCQGMTNIVTILLMYYTEEVCTYICIYVYGIYSSFLIYYSPSFRMHL